MRLQATPVVGVLVVEDDVDIRAVIRIALEAEGYTVATVGNGREALEYLRGVGIPRLILLDLMMPVMDGWQFRAVQQADPAWAGIPVVVVSADGRASQKADALGAAGGLGKPIDLDLLLDVVSRHC